MEQQFAPTQSSTQVLQVSGIKYKYNLANPVGSRIIDQTLTDGTPIANDVTTTYTVTMNEYLATGGVLFSTFLLGTNVVRIGVSDLDTLIEYVQFKYGVPGTPGYTAIDPSIYPKIEGRIIKLPSAKNINHAFSVTDFTWEEAHNAPPPFAVPKIPYNLVQLLELLGQNSVSIKDRK